jgi:NodT family efflux transporter outer membrane factor (OMF) lipoprotein
MSLKLLNSVSAIGLVALLSGCAVGPDFVKPQAPDGAGYAPAGLPAGTDSQSFAMGADLRYDWWREFGSPELDRLVERALRDNPTIPAALATLRQAQEMVYAQQGSFLPTIGGDYNFERQQLAGNLGSNAPGPQGNGSSVSPPAPAKPVIYNLHTAQLQISYNPDVFGGNRRQVESLDAQAEQQRYQLQAAYVTLIDNVVAAAIQEASTRDQIAAVKAQIAADEHAAEILRGQLKAGFAMEIDVAGAELTLAQAEQQLPPLEKQLAQTRDLLRALVGVLPNQEIEEIPGLASLTLPASLPVSLPSRIIELRPDVRAAEEQVRAANANVGVAIADRLPQFTLSGTAGGVATQFSQMFASGGPFWTLVGDVSMPLFDGNTLLHKERAADQALIQANAQYRATVISAYQNVADSLQAVVSDADALKAADKAEKAAKHAFDVTETQNRAGYTDWLTLYTAQSAYQQAVITRVQAQASRYGDTAALYQALGGGWWNRPDRDKDDTGTDFVLDWTRALTPPVKD